MHKLRRFMALSWGQRFLLIRLLGLMLLLRWGLRWFGYKRVHAALARIDGRGTSATRSVEASLQQAREIGRIVYMAARWTHAVCLPRSMALWWLLRRRGIESALRIGVRMERDRLRAHAWVEVQDTVIIDPPTVRMLYAPFSGDMASIRF